MIKTTVLAATLALIGGSALAQAAGNADAGARKIAQCIGCHGIPGYQASFPEIHKVPMIGGQNAKYIVASLQAYAKGDRKHPTMRGVAGPMSEQDMADVAAYYERQGAESSVKSVAAREPSAEVKALLAKGACASCHGADLNKPIDPSYPKIAGQHADYLFVALRSYQIDGNPQVGRNNAVMGGISRQFKPAELRALANHIGAMQGSLVTERQNPFR